jgi:D-3-phosphoglycerate dehydrogenase
MNIGILESDNFSEFAKSQIKQFGVVSELNDQDLKEFVFDKHILFVRLKYFIGEDLLKSAPNLLYICSPTTGLNHIDLDYCTRRNINIISLRGENDFLKNIKATPEHTLGLIIGLYRKYSLAFQNTNNVNWNRENYRGNEINGSKIGFVGFGRVAKIVSLYLKTMGAQVAFFDIKNSISSENNEMKCNDIKELVSWSECVVLTASYMPENGVIINDEIFDLMKDKYFVNTARAELTQENYLIKKISENYFKGVALDVIQNEQNEKNKMLNLIEAARNKNVIITPHIGGATFDSMKKTEDFITSKLTKYLDL